MEKALLPRSIFSSRLNGDVYVGNFEKDLEEGQGVKTYGGHPTFARYDGSWSKGCMHGKGKLQ